VAWPTWPSRGGFAFVAFWLGLHIHVRAATLVACHVHVPSEA